MLDLHKRVLLVVLVFQWRLIRHKEEISEGPTAIFVVEKAISLETALKQHQNLVVNKSVQCSMLWTTVRGNSSLRRWVFKPTRSDSGCALLVNQLYY
jgi:hypothetical protein